VRAGADEAWVVLVVGNTVPTIPPERQEHVFELYARVRGTNISGQGLGLNLAREVACLHGSDLRLVSSSNKGTEFEVWFRLACDSALSPPPSRALPNSRSSSNIVVTLPEAKVTGVLLLAHRFCSEKVSVSCSPGCFIRNQR
jgi:hypothetical protein